MMLWQPARQASSFVPWCAGTCNHSSIRVSARHVRASGRSSRLLSARDKKRDQGISSRSPNFKAAMRDRKVPLLGKLCPTILVFHDSVPLLALSNGLLSSSGYRSVRL